MNCLHIKLVFKKWKLSHITPHDMLHHNHINSESDIPLMISNIRSSKDGSLTISIYVTHWMKFGIYELSTSFSKMTIFKWFFSIHLFRSAANQNSINLFFLMVLLDIKQQTHLASFTLSSTTSEISNNQSTESAKTKLRLNNTLTWRKHHNQRVLLKHTYFYYL